jgi:hypothetical protein
MTKSFRPSVRQPIIILGMHRSGTTMVTQMLKDLGLFVGDDLDINCESKYFYKINYWVFRIGVSKPDYPDNMQYMVPACKEVVLEGLDYYMQANKRKAFLGNKKLQDIRDLDIPWGWKEPKNTFTIDLWKQLFPGAKIIHIYRNPLDSVNSYIKRDAIQRNKFSLTFKKKLKRFFMIADKYHQNFRMVDHVSAFPVWKSYVEKAMSLHETYPDDIITVKYEDFLEKPFTNLKQILDFIQLPYSELKLEEATKQVKPERGYAFLQDADSVEFYKSIQHLPIMKQLGYDNLG